MKVWEQNTVHITKLLICGNRSHIVHLWFPNWGSTPRMFSINWIQPCWWANFHSMKAAQWCMKPEMVGFPGLKVPGSEAALPHHWAHRACALDSSFSSVCNLSRAGYFGMLLA